MADIGFAGIGSGKSKKQVSLEERVPKDDMETLTSMGSFRLAVQLEPVRTLRSNKQLLRIRANKLCFYQW